MSKFKKFMRRGSGELLGFAIILPMFVWILMYIVSIVQISLAKEQLSYLAYATARAAVVSESYQDAVDNANNVLNMTSNLSRYSNKSVNIKIEGVTGTPNPDDWHKGAYIIVTVKCDVDVPIGSGERSSEKVMMIERPA